MGRVASAVGALCIATLAVVPTQVARSAAVPVSAFPGAEGFGAMTTGGRGGKVVIVTTLDPYGAGSLGDALDPKTCEPRVIVFRVSGVIKGSNPIKGHSFDLTCGNVTVAGQTAPGSTVRGGSIGTVATVPTSACWPIVRTTCRALPAIRVRIHPRALR